MNAPTLIRRSLRFYWRTHIGVVLGAAVATAILVGALAVGDSVRYTLGQIAARRLGRIELAILPQDRFFRSALADDLGRKLDAGAAAALVLDGSVKKRSTDLRANRVQVLGVDGRFWALSPRGRAAQGFAGLGADEVLVNEALARKLQLGPGDWLVIKVARPGLLSRDAPLSGSTQNVTAIPAKVRSVLGAGDFGRFDLRANQISPYNVYVPLDRLGDAVKLGTVGPDGREATLAGRANTLLVGRSGDVTTPRGGSPDPPRRGRSGDRPRGKGHPAAADRALRESWTLADADLSVRQLPGRGVVELRTGRVFLDPAAARAAAKVPGAMGVLTYLVTRIGVKARIDPRPLAGALASWCAGSRGPMPLGAMMWLAYELSRLPPATPYSMVSALGPLPGAGEPRGGDQTPPAPAPRAKGPPAADHRGGDPKPPRGGEAPSFRIVPPDLRDDEIVINRWLAEDLGIGPNDEVNLRYFVLGPGRTFVDRSRTFRVREVRPLTPGSAERDLMPDFPDLAGKNSCAAWDPGLPAEQMRDMKEQILPKDERYWRDFRGTPKGFVTLSAGQEMWSNRFGSLTGVRWPLARTSAKSLASAILAEMEPAQTGVFFQPVGQRARKAGGEALDFGPLFLGLSMFLIAASLILTGLLFAFNVQQRTEEIGTLLALGFKPARVRWLLLAEGASLAVLGALLGTPAGLAYTKGALGGLATVWRGAVAGSEIRFHADPLRVLLGAAGGVAVAIGAIVLVLARQARRPARELLAGGDVQPTRRPAGRILPAGILAGVCAAGAAAAVVFAAVAGQGVQVAAFFAAGALLLVGGVSAARVLLSAIGRRTGARAGGRRMSLASLGLQNATRRRGRSLAVVALLACGSFLIVAVGANRRGEPADVHDPSSPTGGFALYAESSVGILHDLNTDDGRRELRLAAAGLAGVRVVAGRLLEGDDASCLNLNRAQLPRLVGLPADVLGSRGAFRFVRTLDGRARRDPWSLLKQRGEDGAVPAVADQGTLQWALDKKLGDVLTYFDERGGEFDVRLVGALENSILQGSLVVDEAAFIERYPSRAGYRVFLIDAPPGRAAEVEAALSRDLEGFGLDPAPTPRRLAAFNEVQNTYLAIFQALGALGLLLGSAGLALVVLRNVLERRQELALMRAVGFSRRRLRAMILCEHWGLLAAGLVCGVVSAAVAVYPAVVSAGAEVPYGSLAWTLAAVAAGGVLWTVLAAVTALRGDLLPALRNE